MTPAEPALQRRHSPDRRQAASRRLPAWLTVDRALLILIFSMGMWYGTQGVQALNLTDAVKTLQADRRHDQEEIAQLKVALAVTSTRLVDIDRRLASIDQNLEKVARAVEHLPSR